MTKAATESSKPVKATLRQQVLLAALDCSQGDLTKEFTAEELLLAAWKRDPFTWGLAGHETDHPDSEKIYTELDRVSVGGRNVRGGLVAIGLFEKVRRRTFRLTPMGVAQASSVIGADSTIRAKAERKVADAVAAIVSHSVFREWLRDPALPKHFRDAGHFWGVAAGTPPSVIRRRICEVDNTLDSAISLLDEGGTDEASTRHGRTLFDRNDIERAKEFQGTLKQRFSRDLETLQVVLT